MQTFMIGVGSNKSSQCKRKCVRQSYLSYDSRAQWVGRQGLQQQLNIIRNGAYIEKLKGGRHCYKHNVQLASERAKEGAQSSANQHNQPISNETLVHSVKWPLNVTLWIIFCEFLSIVFNGSILLPSLLELVGLQPQDLSRKGQAILHLVLDAIQMCSTLAILTSFLSKYRPRKHGLFKFSLRGSWYQQVALACLSFPVVDCMAHKTQTWFQDPNMSLQGTEYCLPPDFASSIISIIVLSIFAPLWEEIFFRGFLTPALRKYCPNIVAVAISSIIFALAHLSVPRLFTLFVLGLIISAVYQSTNNLLSAIAVHSLWNLYILTRLMLSI